MEPEEKSNGALVGSIIIIIILVLGGIYFWKTSMVTPTTTTEESGIGAFESSSNIEAELDSLEIESLDEGL